jgi:hypothetical protein
MLEALCEVTSVLDFVLSIEAAFGRNPYEQNWNVTPDLEQLIIGKAVREAMQLRLQAVAQPPQAARPKLIWSRPISRCKED